MRRARPYIKPYMSGFYVVTCTVGVGEMLSDREIRALKPKEKSYMVLDARGLYLEVTPKGSKLWRLRIYQNGKETRRSLGRYPEVSLKEARLKRDEVLMAKAKGENVLAGSGKKIETFRDVAEDWFSRKMDGVRSERHTQRIYSRLVRFVYPAIGQKPITEITAPEVLALLRGIEAAGKIETAHRVSQIISQVFRYGIAIGIAERDPCADLRGALTPNKQRHFPTITDPKGIGALMRAIYSLEGAPIAQNGLLLLAFTFVRPGELRMAEWAEIDMAKAEWRIPAEKMKMKRPHIVPLSTQALEVLERMRGITGHGKYIFPAVRNIAKCDRPMSDGTMTAALRRLGYSSGDFVPHGFRAMASTVLNEHGWPPDAIERQLAHVEKNSVRAAYNHAEHLDIRRKMMQWWGDWLESLRG